MRALPAPRCCFSWRRRRPSRQGRSSSRRSSTRGLPRVLHIDIQAPGDGLTEILITKSENADTVVPPFSPDTTEPVHISSTAIVQLLEANLDFRITTVDGTIGNFSFTFGPNGLVDNTVAVPEPASLALLLAGLLGFGPLARRKAAA